MTMESQQITRITWSKEIMIDYMLTHPGVTQDEIAAVFDRTPTWISIVINSDSFKAALEERRREFADPVIMATIKDKLQAAASKSIEMIVERLHGPIPPKDDFLLETAKLATAALGYGAKSGGDNGPQVQFIVNMPQKHTVEDWSTKYGAQVIENGS